MNPEQKIQALSFADIMALRHYCNELLEQQNADHKQAAQSALSFIAGELAQKFSVLMAAGVHPSSSTIHPEPGPDPTEM